MNEFKSLTDEIVEQMYFKAARSARNICELTPPNDRAYLKQRARKLRKEWQKRNGQ